MKRLNKIKATLDELAAEVGAYLMLAPVTGKTDRFDRCEYYLHCLRERLDLVETTND